MDAFFASIEERENPQFKGKSVIVGADPKTGHGRGVVSACNYEARKYGIRRGKRGSFLRPGMPISQAYQLCPNAIFLPVNMELYRKVSENIIKIIKNYSPRWEIVSIDEAYLDISFLKDYQKTKKLAEKIKKEIFEKEKLSSTIGIGPNKLIAKIASEKAKPDGLLVIRPSQVRKFLEPLDIEDLPGVGPKTSEKLRNVGVNKIKELKKISKPKLKEMFGLVGEKIYKKSRGIDKEPVTSEQIVKSVGKEHTFEIDTRDPEIIFETFDKIIRGVWQELVENKFISLVKTITVVCRFSGFETHSKSKTFKKPAKDSELLKKESKKLLLKFLLENKKPVRLIGLRIKLFRTGT